jgi:hypothetical protein
MRKPATSAPFTVRDPLAPLAPIACVAPTSPGAPTAPGALEHALVLEAKVFWGRDLVAVRHVRARRVLRAADLGLGVHLPYGDGLVVASVDERGALVLRLPDGAVVPTGCQMTLRFGRSTLRLELVPDDVSSLPRTRADGRAAAGILLAAALHVIALLVITRGPASGAVTEEVARQAFQRMLVAAEASAVAQLDATGEAPHEALPEPHIEPRAAASSSAAAARSQGAPRVPSRGLTVRGGDAATSRGELTEAAAFGILGLIAREEIGAGASAAFATEPPGDSRTFPPPTVDELGSGALALSGVGSGAGGLGAGVPLSGVLALATTRTSP